MTFNEAIKGRMTGKRIKRKGWDNWFCITADYVAIEDAIKDDWNDEEAFIATYYEKAQDFYGGAR